MSSLTRVAHSSFCENSCSYCHATNSLASSDAKKPPSFPTVFPCNTIYRADFKQWMISANAVHTIEVPAIAFTNASQQETLKNIHALNTPLIIIIDYIRPDWDLILKKWDSQVTEYRVIPTQQYTPEAFLQEMPVFILKKLKWAFPKINSSHHELFEPDHLHQVFADQDKKFWIHEWSSTQWDRTLQTTTTVAPTNPFIYGFSSEKNNFDWPSQLAIATSDYVGRWPDSLNIDQYSSIIKNSDLVYFTTPSKINSVLLHPLTHFVIRKSLWMEYLDAYQAVDIFSWNIFLKRKQPCTTTIDILPSPEITTHHLQEQARIHFMSSPDESFYSTFFPWLGHSKTLRQIIFNLFIIYFKITFFVNQKLQIRDYFLFIFMHKQIQHSVKYFKELSSELRHFVKSHLWVIPHFIHWKIFSPFYGHIVAPGLGFLVQLTESPKEWDSLPRSKKWTKKIILFIKKWAWLGKKAIGF